MLVLTRAGAVLAVGVVSAVCLAEARLKAHVDPRVELLSIVFRLAGNPEYNMATSASPYAERVAAHFGRFGEHAAVVQARELRAQRGISYDAVMSLAVHLADTQELAVKVPLDKATTLERRWQPAEAEAFVGKLRSFVADTGFNRFCAEQAELYEAAGARLTAVLSERDYLGWLEQYFGQRAQAELDVIVGLLNGGGCYGVTVRPADGRDEIKAIIGAWSFDEQGRPVFTDGGFAATIMHEFCHAYVNPLVDKYERLLQPAGERMFRPVAAEMRRMAYGNWKTMMYESLVRACVVRHVLTHEGRPAAVKLAKVEYERGFKWMGKLVKLLEEYEADRARYPTLDAFMPRVVVFFDEYAESCGPASEPEQAAAGEAPRVLEMNPANGATDVDPGLTAITVRFDRRMADRSWSVCGGGEHYPELAGEIRYDEGCTVLTIPVRLKPNWEYQFALNCPAAQNFVSAAGVPLQPVMVSFRTRDR
jgi:hypothetical protein